VTCSSTSLRRAWFPPEVRSDAGLILFARQGPASLVPLRHRSYRAPPTPATHAGPDFGLPRLRPPVSPPSARVSQVAGSSSSNAPCTKTPHKCAPILCHRVMSNAVVFRQGDALDTRNRSLLFEAYFTRLTRLRTYASPGPLPSRFYPLTHIPVARLATDPPGWPDRTGFAPAR